MILILGVTASGKGRLAFDLASKIDAEIISIDSMKVYRRMDIGTAKPASKHRQQIKYHLLDVVEPYEPFRLELPASLEPGTNELRFYDVAVGSQAYTVAIAKFRLIVLDNNE